MLTNLRKLKELELYDNKLIERVYIDGVNVHPIAIKNVPILFYLSLAPCKNLILLKLCQLFIMDERLQI